MIARVRVVLTSSPQVAGDARESGKESREAGLGHNCVRVVGP